MDLNDQFQTEHLYLTERTCKVCRETKDLIDGFYKIRKNKYNLSSYSYECKKCTIIRISKSRKLLFKNNNLWEYPDW